jgi:hypothetical protein
MIKEHLEQFAMADQFTFQSQEYFDLKPIKQKKLLIDLLKDIDYEVPIQADRDTCIFTLDKRFRKYICFYNAQFSTERDKLIIFESKVHE